MLAVFVAAVGEVDNGLELIMIAPIIFNITLIPGNLLARVADELAGWCEWLVRIAWLLNALYAPIRQIMAAQNIIIIAAKVSLGTSAAVLLPRAVISSRICRYMLVMNLKISVRIRISNEVAHLLRSVWRFASFKSSLKRIVIVILKHRIAARVVDVFFVDKVSSLPT